MFAPIASPSARLANQQAACALICPPGRRRYQTARVCVCVWRCGGGRCWWLTQTRPSLLNKSGMRAARYVTKKNARTQSACTPHTPYELSGPPPNPPCRTPACSPLCERTQAQLWPGFKTRAAVVGGLLLWCGKVRRHTGLPLNQETADYRNHADIGAKP